ncbi:general secretion pathway protein GspB, partial [Ramlibacter alkalitolerans]
RPAPRVSLDLGMPPPNAPVAKPVAVLPPPAVPVATEVSPPAPPPLPPAERPLDRPVVKAPAPVVAPEAPAAPAVSRAPSAPAAVAADRVLAPSELPSDVQRELPKLQVSGGVYSENPGQRMLIVGGQVVGEGAEAAPGVLVEQIRARSAVLKFRGYRYSVQY